MSSESAPAQAGPSGSKLKRMVDGREETNEERKARKEAKRAVSHTPRPMFHIDLRAYSRQRKAAATVQGIIEPSNEPESSTVPETADAAHSTTTEKKASKKDKKRKRTIEEGTERVAGGDAGGSGGAGVTENDKKEVATEALDPAEEKRAKKAARKAVS